MDPDVDKLDMQHAEEQEDSDNEGEDFFLPSRLEEEKHLTPIARIKTARSPKIAVVVSLVACGILIVVITLIVTGIAVYESLKLKGEENTSPPPTNPPPSQLEWWKTSVIYQCYPRSYNDSDGDGSGDLRGIIGSVPYLSALGVKALWLNPIFTSPQLDNGYDISNYTDVDPLFGNLEQLKQLIRELHDRDMHLLLDFVPNHTSDEHPWFVESRQSRDNPRRHWYVWADGKQGNNSNEEPDPPNNWISVFGGSAWTYDNQTGQFYLHQFSEFQPDLNYSNPEVREAFENVLKYWLELGVDGFRIDAVAHLLENSSLPDEPIDPCHSSDCDDGCYSYLTHIYTRNYPGIHDVIRGWRRVLDDYSKGTRKRFMVGEAYESTAVIMSYYGSRNGSEFHFPFNFFLLTNNNWDGVVVNNIVQKWLTNMPQGAWPNWVLGNHDNHRIASKAGYYLARALNVLLLTLPGTPTTYYGEEILMTNVDVSEAQRKDLYGDRDKERTPMQWSDAPNAGFTTGTPWLPVADNYSLVNVQVEKSNHSSMLNLYSKLVEMRSTFPAFINARNYQLVLNTSAILAYVRFSDIDPTRFLVVINFSHETVHANINIGNTTDDGGFGPTGKVYLSSHLNRKGETVNFNSTNLQGGEALIFKSG